MLQFLLDKSIMIVALLAFGIFAYGEVKRYMNAKGLDRAQLTSSLRQKVNEVGQFLFPKIISATILTVTISIVSFREIWVNDIFHVIFLTVVLFNRLESYMAKLIDKPTL